MIEATPAMRDALWRALPSEVQEGREPDDILPWVRVVCAEVDAEWDRRVAARPVIDPTRTLPSDADGQCGARGFAVGPGCVRRAGHDGGHGYSDGSGEQDGQCGAAGPDGIRCGRKPGHPGLLFDGEDLHAEYSDESGQLVRW